MLSVGTWLQLWTALMIDMQSDAFVTLLDRPLLLLLMAGMCLVVALRFTGRAVRPIGVIFQSAAAAVAIGVALGSRCC